MKVEPGIYRHYKGGYYQVIGVARHSETEELLVVYRSLNKDLKNDSQDTLWVRPAEMFIETVSKDGSSIPRFSHISEGR